MRCGVRSMANTSFNGRAGRWGKGCLGHLVILLVDSQPDTWWEIKGLMDGAEVKSIDHLNVHWDVNVLLKMAINSHLKVTTELVKIFSLQAFLKNSHDIVTASCGFGSNLSFPSLAGLSFCTKPAEKELLRSLNQRSKTDLHPFNAGEWGNNTSAECPPEERRDVPMGCILFTAFVSMVPFFTGTSSWGQGLREEELNDLRLTSGHYCTLGKTQSVVTELLTQTCEVSLTVSPPGKLGHLYTFPKRIRGGVRTQQDKVCLC